MSGFRDPCLWLHVSPTILVFSIHMQFKSTCQTIHGFFRLSSSLVIRDYDLKAAGHGMKDPRDETSMCSKLR